MTWRPLRLDSLRAVVAKYLGRYGMLAPHEAEELDKAYVEIADIQKNCTHCFKEETTFTRTVRRCSSCDLEEPT